MPDTRNYFVEAEIRDACARAGVLESAQEDFIAEFYAGKFDKTNIAKFIEESKAGKENRWPAKNSADDTDLFVAAFGPRPNLSRQGDVVKKLGETRAAEVAAQFSTTLGSTKGGIVPENMQAKIPDGGDPSKPSSNPWSGHPSNLDAHGRYSAKAISNQAQCVRGLGPERAAAIAHAAGAKLGDVRPPGSHQRRVA